MKMKRILPVFGVCLLSAVIISLGLYAWAQVTQASSDGAEVNGFVRIEDFGGIPDDGQDDTQAFLDALASGKNISLSRGVYQVTEALDLHDQKLIGCGAYTSFVVSSCTDATAPVLRLNGACTVKDIGLQFDQACITQSETEGERVAIWLGGVKATDDCHLSNLHFQYVGTGVYAPNAASGGGSRMLFDGFFIQDYTYRGIDFQKDGQYGNLISNVYISSKYTVNTAFAVEGHETNLQVEQLNTEHTVVTRAIVLKNCHSANFTAVHLENIRTRVENYGLVYLENSDVVMQGFTMYYSPIISADSGVFELGNAHTSGNLLQIGTLHLKGLNNQDYIGLTKEHGLTFKFIKRTSGANETYSVDIGQFVWYTWYGDQQIYRNFPCDSDGINYISKGK